MKLPFLNTALAAGTGVAARRLRPFRLAVRAAVPTLACLLVLAASVASCRGAPAPAPSQAPLPEPEPVLPSISLRLVEASLTGLNQADIEYVLEIRNRDERPLAVAIPAMLLRVGGTDRELPVAGATVALPGGEPRAFDPRSGRLGAQETCSVSLAASIPLAEEPDGHEADGAAYSSFELTGQMSLAIGNAAAFSIPVRSEGKVPRVRLPELSIESITVRKMELINTRLAVRLVIKNYNPFDLALGAFDYTLSGEGRFWARGKAAKASVAPARDSLALDLELSMNFADMDRGVLDRVIQMRTVLCRLEGALSVTPAADFLPAFALPFSVENRAPVAR